MHSYIIILCLLVSCEGSVIPLVDIPETRIIDGSSIDIDKAPYQAQYEHIGIPVCGATIISAAYALTAAHCTVRSVVSLVTIRVGSSTRANGGIAHDAVFIIRHERYATNPSIENDIAIVRVSFVFIYNARVQPLSMASVSPTAGSKAVIAGWGVVQEGGQPSTTLRQASAEVLARSACNATLGGRLGASSLCAGGGDRLCQHDLGGGLVVGGQLVGIASWGAGCGQASSPAVYADVAALRTWVYNNCGI